MKARACVSALLAADPGEFLLKARESSAAIDELLLAAGPCRMRLGIDVEVSVSPSLPQVVRVVNSVPSVMITLMV